MSIYKGTELLAGVATNTIYNAHDLFDNKWTDHQLNDQSWLRADTFSWQDGTVYTNAYNHLVADYQGGTSQTETVGSYTITYVLASDGHKITTDETNVANIYNESGVAWYYILDTTNQRFKLPRTKYGFVGLRDTVGKYVPESLPNISYSGIGGAFDTNSVSNGAFTFTGTGSVTFGSGSTTYKNRGTSFSASNSSSTYQDNAPVQQRATQMYLYFYVGQFSQSATEQTAGVTTETLNGKADTDAGNLSTTGKSLISGLGMPSDYYEDMANTTYTASANGYACFCAASGVNNGHVTIVVNDNLPNVRRVQARNYNAGQAASLIMPVRKGETVVCSRESNGTIYYNKFIYAEGEV